jgi:hypothetical protein
MQPSDIGLAVYRHFTRHESGEWIKGQFVLAIPPDTDPTLNRYERTDNETDGEGGAGVYLFDTPSQRQAFMQGLLAAGDDMRQYEMYSTNLGCPALIRQITAVALVLVFDLRGQDEMFQEKPASAGGAVPVYHRQAKQYGGNVVASPEFMLSVADRRIERGEAAITLSRGEDADPSKERIDVEAALETYPGGARTVPCLSISHGADQQRLFRIYSQARQEHLLLPGAGVKFKPHLLPSGTMGFIVSREEQNQHT